jgi:broad specificity phosphatase PhoE
VANGRSGFQAAEAPACHLRRVTTTASRPPRGIRRRHLRSTSLVPVASNDSQGRLFLLRHGETEWSATGKHTGRTDIPLTDRGRELARAAGRTFAALRGDSPPPVRVLVSPRSRAQETAKLAGLTPDAVDERLVEWDYGDYEGLTTPEIRRTDPGWTVWSHPTPGGESAEQVGARADAVLADVRSLRSEGDVVLVGHGHFSRVLMARWIGLPPAGGAHLAMDPAAWSVLGDERSEPRLDHVNLRLP